MTNSINIEDIEDKVRGIRIAAYAMKAFADALEGINNENNN